MVCSRHRRPHASSFAGRFYCVFLPWLHWTNLPRCTRIPFWGESLCDILLAKLLRQNVFSGRVTAIKCPLPGPPTVHSSQSLPLVLRYLYGASFTLATMSVLDRRIFGLSPSSVFTPQTIFFAGSQAFLLFQPVRGFLFRLFTPTGVSPTLGGSRSGSISLLR